ncbi:MAG: HPr family phosphocarrier protein [Agathobacter rectalis]
MSEINKPIILNSGGQNYGKQDNGSKSSRGTSHETCRSYRKKAGKFDSDVTIVFGDKRINAKSLVNIIAACIKKDAEITFECEGADEKQHLQRWKSSRQTTSEINQPAKSIGGVICTKESPAQKESESEMWSLSKSMR